MQTVPGWEAAETRRLVAADNVQTSVRVLLLDRDLTAIDDLTGAVDLDGSEDRYDADGDIPGSCTVLLDRRIDFGRQLVAPHVTLTDLDTGTAFTVPHGVYRLAKPVEVTGGAWDCPGRDRTCLLDDAHGDTVTIDVDADPVAKAVAVAAERGVTLRVAASGEARTMTRPRSWSRFDPTLTVVSDLLAEAGYTRPYGDPVGQLRTRPLTPTVSRPVEWTYDTADPATTVAPDREWDDGLAEIPNRLYGVTDSPLAWAAIEGDGIHVVEDLASIEAYGPRTVEARLAALDQAALVAATEAEFARLRLPAAAYRMKVAPNPLHWVDDVVQVVDHDPDVQLRGVVTRWTLPWDGSDMPLTVGTP